MASAIVKIYFSDNVELFAFYMRNGGKPERLSQLLKSFCDINDRLVSDNKMNWDYVATNFLRYIQDNFNTDIEHSNYVRIADKDETANYNYKLIPDKDLYKNNNIPMNEALNLILL